MQEKLITTCSIQLLSQDVFQMSKLHNRQLTVLWIEYTSYSILLYGSAKIYILVLSPHG